MSLRALEEGKWADFVVFGQAPLADIKNTRTLETVWIAGNLVAASSGNEAAD